MFQQEILESVSQIEEATSKLFDLETHLENICKQIQTSLGFDFAGISLVSLEQNTIEAVYGSGVAAKWVGRAKHYLEENFDLRDIQADIVQTGRIEIIAGWDSRFDRWIYEEYRHEELTRIFVPILLVLDESGEISKDWFETCQWEVISESTIKDDHRVVIEVRFPDPQNEEERTVDLVIGTVEAGYQNRQTAIGIEKAVALAKLLGREALNIRKVLLPHVLETIAENARQIVHADSATLHFLYEQDQGHYIYEVFAGCISKHFLNKFPPRRDGLGRQSLREGKPIFIPDLSKGHDNLELKRVNPNVYEAGTRAMAAFPFHVDHREGVLYIEFKDAHQFTNEEIHLLGLFTNRAVDAIQHATIYRQMHSRAIQLTTLHSVTQSLAQISEKGVLLRHIAWETLNILAADVVTIYEYIQTERCFVTPPDVAGRFKAEKRMSSEINEEDVPSLLVRDGENIYASQIDEERIFRDSDFASRESIKSVAGILLKVGEETVGVMFINYRRYHRFSEDEQRIIETLASSAAIAIKNQRLLQTLSDIDREIITTLDQEQLLNLIVQRAVQLTGADVGNIRLLDPSRRVLITKAKYPAATINYFLERTSIDEGITGWVAKTHQSALVNDVRTDSRYIAFPPNDYSRSELCVPLLDKDRHLLGVLNVENRRIAAFDRRHQGILEALADQAVIGIQNVENKNQLVKAKAMATLGDLAAPLVHRMNNDVGAIRTWAQDILDEGDAFSQDIAAQILSRADQVLQGADRMRIWVHEKPKPINLHHVVINALRRVSPPPKIIQNIDNSLSGLPEVLGGEQQLINVFDNLIQNATDAMLPSEGTLSISGKNVNREGGYWIEVEICDTGVGIAQENFDRIFLPDYTTKVSRRGMGFGLWWARVYIERLGGDLAVDSQINEGARFILMLPVHKPEA